MHKHPQAVQALPNWATFHTVHIHGSGSGGPKPQKVALTLLTSQPACDVGTADFRLENGMC